MSSTLELTAEDANFKYFVDYFEGAPIRFKQNKETLEVSIYIDDNLAKSIGYQDKDTMMGSDEILDGINKIHQETGIFPLNTTL